MRVATHCAYWNSLVFFSSIIKLIGPVLEIEKEEGVVDTLWEISGLDKEVVIVVKHKENYYVCGAVDTPQEKIIKIINEYTTK